MNQEIKKQWVASLRSGKYIQGRGDLKNDATETCNAKHCCLGVLTEIYAKEHGLEFSGNESALKGDAGNEYLNQKVMDWAQLDSDNPCIGHKAKPTHLACLNDAGESFSTIADLIEEQL